MATHMRALTGRDAGIIQGSVDLRKGNCGSKEALLAKFYIYHPFQNHCTQTNIFEWSVRLQLSGVCRIHLHCCYSFLILVAECSYRK